MARGRKKENLTPEERLQAALVPESEQPYKVPRNWCWVRLGQLYQINPKNLAEDAVDAAFIPMEKIAPGLVNEYSFEVQPWGKAKKGHTQFANGDVAFAKISPCFENRKSMFLNNLPNGIGGGTTELVILRQSHMNQKYTFWFISQEQFIRGGVATYSGTVGQQRISMDYVRTYPVPVPPPSEQYRIVDRIEILFAKLDEAKQKAQDALDSFETRKAAILHKAFTGELTAQWRKEHDVGMESWKQETLESVCHSIFDGDHMPPPKSEQGIPFLVISNVNTGHLSFKNTRFVPKSYYEALSDTRKPRYGDVLYTLVGSYGIPVIVDSEIPFCFQRHMALLKPKAVNSYYLWYILQSRKMFEKATQIATGTAQMTVPIKGLRKLQFNCAPVNEQTEIVRILDDLLAKEQQAKEAAEKVLEQIDLIKKSILARAFRGELGTNDPSEESAVELLRQVLSTSDR